MSWSRVSPDHYQRPLGENEAYIKAIAAAGPSRREHWSINADATYQTQLPREEFLQRLQNAWKVLRFQHPSIAAIAHDKTVDYHIPTDAATLEKWLSESFIVEKSRSLEDVIATESVSPYVTLRIFPETQQILLHNSHWRADGVGVLLLFNAYFALVGSSDLPDPSALKWGEEIKNLAPSVEAVLNLPAEPTEAIQTESKKWMKTFEATDGAAGIACSTDASTPAKGTRMVRTSLSESTTTAILTACKSAKISVTTAVHAALAETNWHFSPASSKTQPYTSTIRATLRTFLPKPFWPAYAAGLYTSGYMHTLPPNRTFAENARELNDLYRAGVPKELVEATRQYAIDLQNLFERKGLDVVPTDVDVSSVGIMDKLVAPTHGALELTHVGVGVEMQTRQMICFAWTFRGKLTLSLVYNEAYYPVEVPTQFLAKLQEILARELGVQQ